MAGPLYLPLLVCSLASPTQGPSHTRAPPPRNCSAGGVVNVTAGVCCDGGGAPPLRSFACNASSVCCAACRNDTRCSTWVLVVPPPPPTTSRRAAGRVGAPALPRTCALIAGPCVGVGARNCTRQELRPPALPPTPTPPSPPTPAPPRPPPGGLSFKFVATWRGTHKLGDSNHSSGQQGALGVTAPAAAVGECTCSLIAPLWVITAEHCAERVLKHERTKVKVNFHGDSPHVERGVTHCIAAGHDEDIAICHLTRAVHAFPPLAVNPVVMKTGHGAVDVLTVGTMGGLHHPKKRLEYERNGAHLHVRKGGGMKAGDSGAPWVMQARGTHYLVGVAHGSGIAGQVSHVRAFLDKHIGGITWAKP
jgi:hypothetical protein